MALKHRQPAAGLLHHSDQGSPYASEDYQRLIKETSDDRQHEPSGQLLRL